MRASTSTLGITFLGAVGLFAAGVAATAALAAPPPTEPASTPPVASPPAAPEVTGAPAGSGTTTESITGSGAPSGSASADPKSLLPFLRGADIPTTASDKPKEAEWKEGRKVRPHRGGEECDLVLVREWLRVTCKSPAGLGLIAGDPKGVTLWMGGSIFGVGSTLALVQMPLARGTSRVFSFTDVAGDWDWVGLGEGGTMSVTWRDGEPDPVIGIYGSRERDR